MLGLCRETATDDGNDVCNETLLSARVVPVDACNIARNATRDAEEEWLRHHTHCEQIRFTRTDGAVALSFANEHCDGAEVALHHTEQGRGERSVGGGEFAQNHGASGKLAIGEHHRDNAADAVERRPWLASLFRESIGELAADTFDDRVKECFFGAEVVGDRAQIGFGARDDVAHRHRVKAGAGKEVTGNGEETFGGGSGCIHTYV